MSSKSPARSAWIVALAAAEPSPLIGTTTTSSGARQPRAMDCSSQVMPAAAASTPSSSRIRNRRKVICDLRGSIRFLHRLADHPEYLAKGFRRLVARRLVARIADDLPQMRDVGVGVFIEKKRQCLVVGDELVAPFSGLV